uniref:Uncharacterized protein LOC110203888 isoform X2 n=1 Tax=Phascolarctos cinereus TaxID=38626 RepID=A0A6P5JP46_PHACI|nr:uncharacterized protein LOC110203888 isoform X2 [Phascolarctos cinereus]
MQDRIPARGKGRDPGMRTRRLSFQTRIPLKPCSLHGHYTSSRAGGREFLLFTTLPLPFLSQFSRLAASRLLFSVLCLLWPLLCPRRTAWRKREWLLPRNPGPGSS